VFLLKYISLADITEKSSIFFGGCRVCFAQAKACGYKTVAPFNYTQAKACGYKTVAPFNCAQAKACGYKTVAPLNYAATGQLNHLFMGTVIGMLGFDSLVAARVIKAVFERRGFNGF
jgi:hypothetical protein